MKIIGMTGVAVAALLSIIFVNAQAAEDKFILQMASCQDSWLEWKDNPVKVKEFTGKLEQNFKMNEQNGTFSPNKSTSVLGHKISQVFPQSVGMGVGFSVILDAPFDAIKASLEKQTGKKFEQCATEEGMKSCEQKIADKKTILLMEGSRGSNPQSLVGCYYYYEK